jgi:hypothetical protein
MRRILGLEPGADRRALLLARLGALELGLEIELELDSVDVEMASHLGRGQ